MQGYLVTLGDGSLDAGDTISGTWVTFTDDQLLGSGSWTWSGTFGGATYVNELEPGDYYLGTDGNVYFVPQFGPVDDGYTADVTTAPSYSAADGIVSGTSGSDLIDSSYLGDPDGDQVDDGVGAGLTGNDDVIDAGAGADTVIAGSGNDSILGGSGDDIIYGDGAQTVEVATEHLSWIGQAASGTDISGGFVQDTGDINLAVSFTNDGGNLLVETSSSTQYVGTGPYATNSGLYLTGGAGPNVTASFDFSAESGSGISDQVENISFVINDVDMAGWQDIVTVNAYDADGNAVPVSFTVFGNDTVSGNTITAANTSENQNDASGAVQVDIAGPVASFEIIYENGGTAGQALWVTDVYYDTVATVEEFGDDTISGGGGDDLIFGGDGNDIIDGDGNISSVPPSPVTIDASNYTDTGSGFTVSGVNVVNSMFGPQQTAPSTANVATYTYNGVTGFGASGTISDSDSSVSQQTGYDMASGLSEELIFDFDQPVTDLSFDFSVLWTADFAEQAQWEIYNDGVLVASGVFTEDGAGTGDGTVDLSAYGEIDQLVVSGLPQTDGTDGSDFLITGVTFTPTATADSAGDDTIYGGGGDDLITASEGADTLFGDEGNDTLIIAEGDAAYGGDGDDLFVLEDLGELTNATITVDGGGTGETLGGGDTLQLGDLADMSTLNITSTTTNPSGNQSYTGSVILDDGTILNFTEIENIICFTPGTRIATPYGARPVETLQVGDLVVTRDHGLQPIRWIEQRTVPGIQQLAPIRFDAGALPGLEREILVSPQHRMLYKGYMAQLICGDSEVLIAAKHLVDGKKIRKEPQAYVTYVHMLFDEHQVVYAEGAATESFHPGATGLNGVTDHAREELFAIFPELRSLPNSYGITARRVLKQHEAALVMN